MQNNSADFSSWLDMQRQWLNQWEQQFTSKQSDKNNTNSTGNFNAGSINNWWQNMLQQTPEAFTEWANFQRELFNSWLNNFASFTKNNQMPAANDALKTWTDQLSNMASTVRQQMPWLGSLNFEPYIQAYNTLLKQWNEFGKFSNNPEAAETWTKIWANSGDYQKVMDALMGFSQGNLPDIMQQSNRIFELWLNTLQNNAKGWQPTGEAWQNWAANPQKSAGWFDYIKQLQELTNQQWMPIKLMSTGNEAVTTEMIRNMQFDYMRYLVKSADLQKMVYTASQTALPEVVKQWQAEGKDNSAFDEFFNRWLTAVERKTVEVMRTDEYANLQSETAQAGLAVKQNMDGIIEMSLADLPIATRTEMADIAMEMSALRHKIMELEKEVKHLRKAHGTTNAVISTTSEQNTTKSGKSKKV
ncbi:MAG: hypothetical protein IPI59_03935 [Sphingobacteriales bacterium]|jgi:hypothetical protein|nr:hypothetical protein [Sphingobacteriales bacterium]MBP9141757.1 hypothetical protein [Chitinophagales bacterium]MDA0197220.1 hypothetical protein [Bacteroidota bacterium]